jgi:hypothetical protein
MTLYAKRKWLYKRFKLHPFDVDECEGEDMTHDVFLSGADEDAGAIMSLYRQLTQLGYRVLFHKIDFVPGIATVDNIDECNYTQQAHGVLRDTIVHAERLVQVGVRQRT